MDNTAWLRQTLIGTAIIDVTGQTYTITDVAEDGIMVEASGAATGRLLTMSEIVTTVHLWAQLGRAPSPAELRQACIGAEHALYLAPLVRTLRSVPQIRTWASSSARADLFMLDMADAAD
ncbi:MAG TPA: hypothetical protein VIL85_18670 [Thermomicrobiales bacterium]